MTKTNTRIGDHYDYNIRQWTLDSAIAANKKGTPADKIIKDASKFYGFLFPNENVVINAKVKLEVKND